jgi:hypothetical protein
MKHAKHVLPGNYVALILVACCKVNFLCKKKFSEALIGSKLNIKRLDFYSIYGTRHRDEKSKYSRLLK